MIDSSKADAALDRNREITGLMSAARRELRDRQRITKYEIARAIIRLKRDGQPSGICKDVAFAEDQVNEAIKKENEADAYLFGLESERDDNNQEISLYQSKVKDRL